MLDQIMSMLAALNNNVLWGIPMVVLMIGTGVFLLIVTKGAVFTRFNVVMRYTTKTLFNRPDKSELEHGAISPFQAVCTALAATLGTGNIVGTGGPGAIFWLWLSALAGMVIKYCEVTLSVAYRTRNERGEIVGGPMYYISRGLGVSWLAVLFAIFGFLASFGIGASVQANSLSAPSWRRLPGSFSSAASNASRRSPRCWCPSQLCSISTPPSWCSFSTRPKFQPPSA